MIRLCAAILAAFLCACASTNGAKQTAASADTPPAAAACTTGTVADLQAKAAEQELELKAHYKGDRLKDFVTFISQFINNSTMLSQADEVLVFQKDKAGLIIFFKEGCALGHAVGPYEVLNEFVGSSA